MKHKIVLFIVFILLFSGAGMSFAAMKENMSTGDTMTSVIQMRQEAQQEYAEYVQEKEIYAKSMPPIDSPKTLSASKKDVVYSRQSHDIMIGIVLLLAALALSGYLYKISRDKQGR